MMINNELTRVLVLDKIVEGTGSSFQNKRKSTRYGRLNVDKDVVGRRLTLIFLIAIMTSCIIISTSHTEIETLNRLLKNEYI